jgi:hypothetical protein
VIGNPPWGAKIPQSQKPYIRNKYVSKKGEIETYVHFIELCISLLTKSNGLIGLITPNTWYYLDKYLQLRDFLLCKKIDELIELEKLIFEDAPEIVPAVFFLRNAATQSREVTTYKLKKGNVPNFMIDTQLFEQFTVNPAFWKRLVNHPFNLTLTDSSFSLIDKISNQASHRLSELYTVRYGIKTGNNKKYVVKDISTQNENWKYCIPAASCVRKYQLNWEEDWLNYGSHLSGYSKNPFEREKILIQYIRKLSMDERLVCALDSEGKYYPLNNFSFVERKNGVDSSLSGLLALLNSKLMNFFFKNVFIDYNIKPKYIEQLPVVKDLGKLSELSKTVIMCYVELNTAVIALLSLLQSKFPIDKPSKKLQNWPELDFKGFLTELKKKKVKLSLEEEAEWMGYFNKKKTEANALQAEIDRIDKEIDNMVYELYGLTEEEIKIMEAQ